jgi:hypothetical protein
MPSHRVHRTCAELIGISGDVANFVDRLIDLGRCEAHDVGVSIRLWISAESRRLR